MQNLEHVKSWFENKNCSICKGRAKKAIFYHGNLYLVCESKICDEKIYSAEGWFDEFLHIYRNKI